MGLGYVRNTATDVLAGRIRVYLLLLLYDSIYQYLALAWGDAWIE